jgi:hypothetical protein
VYAQVSVFLCISFFYHCSFGITNLLAAHFLPGIYMLVLHVKSESVCFLMGRGVMKMVFLQAQVLSLCAFVPSSFLDSTL